MHKYTAHAWTFEIQAKYTFNSNYIYITYIPKPTQYETISHNNQQTILEIILIILKLDTVYDLNHS